MYEPKSILGASDKGGSDGDTVLVSKADLEAIAEAWRRAVSRRRDNPSWVPVYFEHANDLRDSLRRIGVEVE
jgi:hypothetical protein